MDVAPAIINSRTMVPVKFVAENVGATIEWIASTREIVIVFYSGGSGQAASTAPANNTGNGTTGGASGGLTLDALNKAASDAGLYVEKGLGYDAAGGPEANAGSMLGVMDGSAVHFVIYILEFATPADAQTYKTALEHSQSMDNHSYAYKQFVVEFHSDAYEMEVSLMAAFAKAGWGA